MGKKTSIEDQLGTLLDQVEGLDAKHRKLGKKLKPLADEVEELRASVDDLEELKKDSKATKKKFKKKFAKLQAGLEELVVLQQSMNDLKSLVELLKNGIEAADRKSAGPGGARVPSELVKKICTAGRALTRHDAWKAEKEKPEGLRWQGSVKTKVGGAMLGGIEHKDSDLTDPDSVLQAVLIDHDNIIMAPERTPIHRQLFTVRPLPGVKQITVKKKVRKLEFVAKVTVSQTAGNNTLQVDRLAGLLTDSNFKAIRVHNSATPETHSVTNVTPDDTEKPNGPGTITLTNNLAANADKGKLVTFDVTGYIDEGKMKPKKRAVYEDVDVSIRKLSSWVELSEEELMWAPQLEGRINDDLLVDLSRDEEHQIYHGDGTQGQYYGILTDPDINTITWSLLSSGTTRLDCIPHGIVSTELSYYMPTWILLNPQDWRELLKSQTGDGMYIYIEAARSGDVVRMWGLRVAKSTEIDYGTGLVGSEICVVIFDSMTGTIEVGRINDQLVHGTKTAVATMFSASYVAHPGGAAKIIWDSPPA